jgi:hypothetical protein
MSARKIAEEVQQQVRRRAEFLCEYCHASEKWQYVPFTVDHFVPRSQQGTDSIENLALACFHCNRKKSNKITAIDPQLSKEVPIFNPRTEHWYKHFIWSADGLRIIGLTATGRATVEALAFNRSRAINIRAADKLVNRHPPANDPIQSKNF